MKNRYLISAAGLLLLLAPGCENKSSSTARQLEELERKAIEAVERQRELEQQLEDQKLAAEREAIERERLLIEEDRLELERQQGEAAAAEAEALRQREQALANREGRLQQVQSELEEKEALLEDRGMELNARDRELAGREAIPFEVTESTVPVADYGMFYESLSSYGSWFETPDYGYVWQPAVISDSNWRPYSRGRWVCSDRGWTWVSEEPFGWATYHYGRWALIRGRGWVWVPGTEWAPCWVSWRESGSHIGWAPLPPETMAYRNHRWDSTVDDQFDIGAAWFNFVEIRHFGNPLYQYCLPVSRNSIFIQGTVNITYIHLVNRQVICGGPQYEKINRRLGRPIPFYRLELEGRSRPSRETLGMRPRIKGDRMMVSAPNMDAAWNDGLRPARVKGSIDTRAVERNEPLRPEITDRFKKTREEGQRIARRSVEELGGAENFKQKRVERLEENRRQVEKKAETPVKEREPEKVPDRKPREEAKRDQPSRVERPTGNRVDEAAPASKNPDPVREARPRPPVTIDSRQPDADAPAVTPPAAVRPPKPETQDTAQEVRKPRDPSPPRPQELKEQPPRLGADPRIKPQDTFKPPQATRREETREKANELKNKDAIPPVRKPEEPRPREPGGSARTTEDAPRGLQMDALLKYREQQEKLRQAQQATDAREAARQKQVEQQQAERRAQEARQAREQVLEQQRQREQARETARQQQEKQLQQEAERQRQQEESQRQQQQERERQQQQSRQREQEQNQRQQEKARGAETEKVRVRDSERSRNR